MYIPRVNQDIEPNHSQRKWALKRFRFIKQRERVWGPRRAGQERGIMIRLLLTAIKCSQGTETFFCRLNLSLTDISRYKEKKSIVIFIIGSYKTMCKYLLYQHKRIIVDCNGKGCYNNGVKSLQEN